MIPPARQDQDFKVAIVGGGVCGLTLAVALAKEGVKFDLYEAASKFGEIGAGIGIGPNAVRILQELELIDDVLARSDEQTLNMRSFLFRSGFGEHEEIYDYPAQPDDFGMGIHRAAFLDALVNKVDPHSTHFNKRCTNIEPSGSDSSQLTLRFADGTTASADVVLGADGIKSTVRRAITPDIHHPPSFSNTVAYRGLVPIGDVKAAGVKTDLTKRPINFVGKGKHIIVFPIKGDTVINVVAFVTDRSVEIGQANLPPEEPWVTPVTKEELLEQYAGWGSDVTGLLGCIQNPNKWSIHVVSPPLKSYVNKRIALLGDAAHGMLPHLGAGAGQGLEDAFVLAKLIGHPQTNKSNVERILRVYDKVRLARSQMVWEGSRSAGDKYEGYGPHGFTTEGLREDFTGIWEDVWHWDIREDVSRAFRAMKQFGIV